MNNKGVSVLLGFILLMSILMITFSFLQVELVPALCKEVELEHENSLIYSFYDLTDNLMEDELTAVTFNLGVHYPDYPFFIFPHQWVVHWLLITSR